MTKGPLEEFWRTVKPLKKKHDIVQKPSPPPAPRAPQKQPQQPDLTPIQPSVIPKQPPQFLQQTDRKIARKIQTGKLPIEDRLDLHGHFYQDAQDAVTLFINNAIKNRYRWVLIITGKGVNNAGVLQTSLPQWLTHPHLAPHVISFMPAAQNDGGTGAFYVYLRAPKSHSQ